MTDRRVAGQKAEAFFENLWKGGDPWALESSPMDQGSHARQLAMLEGRRYSRVFEIGCGAGSFTRRLARVADRVVALDIAPSAIERARAIPVRGGAVEFRVGNVMDYDPGLEGAWDLVVLSETICYLGWLYSVFEVGWLAARLYGATADGGRLIMANTCGGVDDYLLRPWLIRTYRDLFLNVGYSLDAEEIFRGTKNGADLEVLISLFTRAPERAAGGVSRPSAASP